MPRGSQQTRQWRLLQFLCRPDGVVVGEAAREMKCAVRTIWRALAVMQEAGLPIYDERAPELGARAFAPTLQPVTTDYLPEIRKALLDRCAVQVRATFDQGAYRVEVPP